MKMRSCTVLCVVVALFLNLTGSFGQQDMCGQASLNTKIIGGGDANEGFWPWQVGIYSILDNIMFCGGTLINKDWVLISAVCSTTIYELSSSDTIIYLGRLNQSGPNPHEVIKTVSHVIIHPNYTSSTSDNDIALLQLSSSVNFTAYIKPICLAAAGSEFDQGLLSWVTGWGLISEKSLLYINLTRTLQEIEIPILSNYNCNIAYNGSFSITDNMMCAGLSNEGKSSSWFNNGGPLVSKQGSRWIQSGIIIMASIELDGSLPGVFTRVSKYQDWISTQIVNDQPGFISYPYYNNNTPDPTTSISDISEIRNIRNIRNTINDADGQFITDIPDITYIPDVPDITYIPDIPDITYIPDISNIPDITYIPDISNITYIPDIPDISDISDIPDIDTDIFSGSSPNLHLFPLYFPIFAIISLIFGPCF